MSFDSPAKAEGVADRLDAISGLLEQVVSLLSAGRPMGEAPERLLSAQEALPYIGKASVAELTALRFQGRGPRYIQDRKGGPVHYRLSDIKQWQDEQSRLWTGEGS